MADDAERLVVLLEARMRDFERNMLKAAGISQRDFNTIRRNSKSASTQMEADWLRTTNRINQALAAGTMKIGAYAKSFATGLVGGAVAGGLVGIVSRLGQVANSVAQVGDEARRAGLSIRAFQELKYVAEQNRIGVDSLVDGMKELNLRADEFIATGKGSAAEAFGRLGYSADVLAKRLKDPSALFTEIIGKLKQFDRAAQIRIMDELFGGTGGEKFVQLIEQGEAGIRATIQEAHRLGAVMDDEVVKRADELDRKFQEITTGVSNGLKVAIVEAAGAMQDFINTFQSWNAEYEKRKAAVDLGALAGSLAGTPPPINKTTPKTDRLPASEVPPGIDLATKFLAAYREELARTTKERAIAAETQRILNDASSRGIRITEDQAKALATEKVARDEAEKAAEKKQRADEQAARTLENLITGTMQHTDELRLETELLGVTGAAAEALRVEQDLMNAAMRAGITVTPELAAKFGLLADKAGEAREAFEAARLTSDLLFERQQLGRSDTDQRIYAELRRANIDIGSETGQRLALEIAINEQVAKQREQYEDVKDTITGMVDVLFEAGDATEKLISSFAQIGKAHVRIDLETLIRLLKGKDNDRDLRPAAA